MKSIIYIVRHGEIEHHRADIGLTARGRKQAKDKGGAFEKSILDGSSVFIHHSPVSRVSETASLIYAGLSAALERSSRNGGVLLQTPVPDPTLCNPRFIMDPQKPPEEPSCLYQQTTDPDFLASLPPRRAAFYREFWTNPDPMGYWLRVDSCGGAETSALVLDRLLFRLRSIFTSDEMPTPDSYWFLVTHSGTMRAFLRKAFGVDLGEPDFCEDILVKPADKQNWITLTFREETASLKL